jgi:diguanylate cyclase
MTGDRSKDQKKPPAAKPAPGISETFSAQALDRSRALTGKTLERLEALALRSTPQFYEVWYRYFEGDPDIVREIDRHEGLCDEIACQKIYNRFLSPHEHDTAVHKAGDQIEKTADGLAEVVGAARTSAAEYNAVLSVVPKKIERAKTLDDLSGVVTDVLAETAKMTEKNAALETRLEDASRQLSELKGQLDAARRDATTDSLTGIANRKAFDRQISQNVETAMTAHTPLLLLMLDIDMFSRFNETHGRQMGDQVLHLVARTLQSSVKGQDMAARYGGEEFAILLPATSLSAGIKIADRLRQSIETKDITNRVTHEVLGRITLSVGIAKYREGEGVAGFVSRAADALEEAKTKGRNRVCVALENKSSPRGG